ncbi:glycosyl transferase family 90-domain-containing protein [Xylaria sp. FL1042]|nr:glycosyl transferase family 90-domain-containing protein [Xylaria sp. FL1042]
MMRPFQLMRMGKIWMLLAWSLLLYLGLLAHSHLVLNPRRHNLKQVVPTSVPSQDVYQFLNLSEQECKDTFPDLTKDLDATIALGPFTLKQANGKGPLQARIKDGQLYIIHSEDKDSLSPELLQTQQAALHQINRAIITSPEALPDTIFALNVRDQPYGTAFSYSRPAYPAPASAMPPITRAFLMPHFAFWDWPLPSIGSISRAAKAISRIEDTLPFARKDPRVVWRGSARFNGAHNPTLRTGLLRIAAGAEWADVRALESYDVGASQGQESRGEGEEAREGTANTTTLMIEDFCRYKYVLYTDGVTYSGRLPFHQMCGSVLLTPPLAWRQLTTHLLQPVFSRDLFSHNQHTGSAGRGMLEGVRNAWPARYAPEDANVVFVAPDWSDLEDTVLWLENHPDIAAGIARRQRELSVGRGYISPAMETCYWRALLRGWSQVVRLEGEGWADEDGVSWEEFSIG